MSDIQKNAFAPTAFHFRIDRPGHDIAGGEFLLRIVLFHEPPASRIEQDAALAADNF